MKNRNKLFIIVLIVLGVLIIFPFWSNGTIPKRIAKIYGTKYMKSNYPKMKLEYDGIVWSKYHGDYLITFKDNNNQKYTSVIGPKYLPIHIGQGEMIISETYREKFSER